MPVKVVELFAGVGGFRLGFQRASPLFDTVWWNQWEPQSLRRQHAWECYKKWFCDKEGIQPPPHSNTDINRVSPRSIPDHDLLVGGFPCQDYSVATSLDLAGGVEGKKGVLWWAIDSIVRAKKPDYLLLENVDRLLRSPASQRGRDFAIVLGCLRRAGYVAEWRVLNAADCSTAQKRRRVFIFAARKGTGIANFIEASCAHSDFLYRTSFFASEFPADPLALPKGSQEPELVLSKDLKQLSDLHDQPFEKAGAMVDGKIWMHPVRTKPEKEVFLSSCLDSKPVDTKYLLDVERLPEWNWAKGAKEIPRKAKTGFEYIFAEGGMKFPDRVDTPARTVLTSEANRTPNRTTHVIYDEYHDALRFLTPTEVERLMGFRAGWTAGMPERWRYFTMGNSLVVPLVTRMGNRLLTWIQLHERVAARKSLLGPAGERPTETPVLLVRRPPKRKVVTAEQIRKQRILVNTR